MSHNWLPSSKTSKRLIVRVVWKYQIIGTVYCSQGAFTIITKHKCDPQQRKKYCPEIFMYSSYGLLAPSGNYQPYNCSSLL